MPYLERIQTDAEILSRRSSDLTAPFCSDTRRFFGGQASQRYQDAVIARVEATLNTIRERW